MALKSIRFFAPMGAALVGLLAAQAQAVIISAVNSGSVDAGDVYVVVAGGLAEDVEVFIDRTHEYNDIPAFLLGADYVQTANDDKTAGSGFSVAVTTGPQVADVYLFIDNRVTPVATDMPWVATLGFVDTGLDLGIDEGGGGVGPGVSIDQTSSIYLLANVAPGTTIFLEQDDGSSRNMYGIAAVAQIPEPTTYAVFGGLMLCFGAAGWWRKRRGQAA